MRGVAPIGISSRGVATAPGTLRPPCLHGRVALDGHVRGMRVLGGQRMKRMLFLLLFVPSLLAAQKDPGEGPGRRPGLFDQDTTLPTATRAYGIGIIGLTGGTWQPSGLEVALLWRLSQHATTSAGATLSLGSFGQDQAALFGRSQGFFVTLGATIRQPIVDIASVGSDRYPASLKIEASADVAGAADIHSPLPQGPWGGRAAALLGFVFGNADPLGQSVGIFFGPAVLLGRTATTHGELAFRLRVPLRQ